jgi:hypothetical protein
VVALDRTRGSHSLESAQVRLSSLPGRARPADGSLKTALSQQSAHYIDRSDETWKEIDASNLANSSERTVSPRLD